MRLAVLYLPVAMHLPSVVLIVDTICLLLCNSEVARVQER